VDSKNKSNQVVSKKRVIDHGEVYTDTREVNAMLDLVKQETKRIESRFLEPACGTGNFLTEILERKLDIVDSNYKRSQLDYEQKTILALSSIYGIDILEDNIIECRKRLFLIFYNHYEKLFKNKIKAAYETTAKYILQKNIIWGDALSLHTVGDKPKPILFSEWSFPFNDSRIKRRDFEFLDLLPNQDNKKMDLFSKPPLFSDLGEQVFIPKETHTHAPVHFLKIAEKNELN
jgi:hypothetical protein